MKAEKSEEKLIIKKNPRLRGEDGYKTFSIRIKEDMVRQLDELAEQSGYSRNELIGTFLSYALAHCEIRD